MKQNLKISVSKEPRTDGILSCRSISVRERILCFFLGGKQKLTILVPGDSVEEVAICTVKEGGTTS